jgi:hypothetical protein
LQQLFIAASPKAASMTGRGGVATGALDDARGDANFLHRLKDLKMRLLKIGMAAALIGGWGLSAAPASAQLFLNDPDFKPGPITGDDPLVGLPLPGATPQEYAAHLIWNLRAGLNVAALQCQFSPFLRTVSNYNGLLAHHSKELMDAYRTVGGYFKRKHGAREGQVLFDNYSTVTYNNFSTLHAQVGFCQTASDIAKEALARPKGQFYLTAQSRVRELRNSLVPAHDRLRLPYTAYNLPVTAVPPLEDKCWDGKNRLKRKCATAYSGAASVAR